MNVIGDFWASVRDWRTAGRLRWRYPRAYWSVLCLHESPPPDRLRAMLRAAAGHYELVSIGTGIARLRGGSSDRPLLSVTYDDADHSIHEHALPVHVELHAPACVYVCTGFI